VAPETLLGCGDRRKLTERLVHDGVGWRQGIGINMPEERRGQPVDWPRRGSSLVGSSRRRWLGRRGTGDSGW
jgi:hypothetical protein